MSKGSALFHFSDLQRKQMEQGNAYCEFLRVPDMSAGFYVLQAGEQDRQLPHHEDELYYVIRGEGRFFHDGNDEEAGAGSVIYIAKGVEHRFHSIVETLYILVIFAPAETAA